MSGTSDDEHSQKHYELSRNHTNCLTWLKQNDVRIHVHIKHRAFTHLLKCYNDDRNTDDDDGGDDYYGDDDDNNNNNNNKNNNNKNNNDYFVNINTYILANFLMHIRKKLIVGIL